MEPHTARSRVDRALPHRLVPEPRLPVQVVGECKGYTVAPSPEPSQESLARLLLVTKPSIDNPSCIQPTIPILTTRVRIRRDTVTDHVRACSPVMVLGNTHRFANRHREQLEHPDLKPPERAE